MTLSEAFTFKTKNNYQENSEGLIMRLYIIPANYSFEEYFNRYKIIRKFREPLKPCNLFGVYGIWNSGDELHYVQLA